MATKNKSSSGELISFEKLDSWVKHRYNVLFSGKHGVGKTAIILRAFKRAGLRYAYFSGATLDPWIDFIGVPIKVHNPKTGKDTIQLLRPQHLVEKDVQAIFMDELNRTHKKVRNALMELMQFKTINGEPISSDLRVVWAAVNPDDDEGEYDVERLDPAQQDRFHIQVNIPFQCSAPYFERKYGEEGLTAVKYWNNLLPEIKAKVSPRRLDYALKAWNKGDDLRDVLPVEVNPGKLRALLKGGYEDLDDLLNAPDKAKKFFANESNYATYIDDVINVRKYHNLLDMLMPEKIVSLLNGKHGQTLSKHIWNRCKAQCGDNYLAMLKEIVDAGQGKKPLLRWAGTMLARFGPKNKAKVVPNGSVVKKGVVLRNPTNVKSTFDVLCKLCFDIIAKGTSRRTFDVYNVQKDISGYLSKNSSLATCITKVQQLMPRLAKAGYSIKQLKTAGGSLEWEVQ